MKIRFDRASRVSALIVAGLCSVSAASANSRFPRAQRLIEHPSDMNKLYLAATYGILTTVDRGQNWYHVCETAFSFQTGYGGDPILSLTGDGSMLVGTQASLSLSTNQGCEWKQTLMSPAMPKESFFDFTVSPSAAHPVLAVSTTYQTAGPPVNQLEESTDNGATWKLIGMPLPVVVINTIDVDPTDPTHIFATGLTTADDSPNTGVFLVSTNHGTSWTSYPILNTFSWASPYIAGVHPTDPKKIFVRTDGWKDRDNVQTADDSLLYSADGGKTWTELLHAGGPADSSPGAKLFGFALSPDGSTVLAGYGDPVDGSRLVEPSWFGVYKSSSDGKYTFGADPANPTAMLPVDPVSCITWTKNGIYLCLSPQGETSLVGFAKDPTFTARAQLSILMRADQTRGIPTGCAGRASTTCDWSVDCAILNACDGGAPTGTTTTTSGGTPGAGGGSVTTTGPGGGGAGGGGGRGSGGASSTTTTTGGAGGTNVIDTAEKPKCSCRAPGAPSSGGAAAMGSILGALLVVGRRRSRRAARARG